MLNEQKILPFIHKNAKEIIKKGKVIIIVKKTTILVIIVAVLSNIIKK